MIEIKLSKYLKQKLSKRKTRRFFGEQVEFIRNQSKWKAR